MNIKKYRNSKRGFAFFAINNSRKQKMLIVEGRDDIAIYQHVLDSSECEKIHVYTPNFSDVEGSTKKSDVKKLRSTIEKLDNIKNIAFLVDKDYSSDKEEGNLFVTDYHSIENYPIVADRGNKYFKRISDLDKSLENELRLIASSDTPEWYKLPGDIKKHKIKVKNPEKDDLKILKKLKGKLLFKHLKKVSTANLINTCIRLKVEDFPVLKRIEGYLSESKN